MRGTYEQDEALFEIKAFLFCFSSYRSVDVARSVFSAVYVSSASLSERSGTVRGYVSRCSVQSRVSFHYGPVQFWASGLLTPDELTV